MDKAHAILERLYDHGDGYLGLHELATATGLTLAQTQRRLDTLAARGHRLDYSPAHGVALVRPPMLDAHLIERRLDTLRVGRNVICFPEVASTNDVALACARQKDADGLAVLAESQRAGRGRLGRSWISPPGANILLSVLLVDDPPALAHEALTIAAGLAVAEGIEQATGLTAGLKWPNDVLLEGRKAAGILVELRKVDRRRCLVVGIGLNANAAPPAGQVDRPPACLAEFAGAPVDRIAVVQALLRRLDAWVLRIAAADLDELHRRWVARCSMLNERITAVSGGTAYVGRVLDVSPLEGLILACDNGQRVHLPAEGATLRP